MSSYHRFVYVWNPVCFTSHELDRRCYSATFWTSVSDVLSNDTHHTGFITLPLETLHSLPYFQSLTADNWTQIIVAVIAAITSVFLARMSKRQPASDVAMVLAVELQECHEKVLRLERKLKRKKRPRK